MVKITKTLNMRKEVISKPKPVSVPVTASIPTNYPVCKKCGKEIIPPNQPTAHHGQIYCRKCLGV